jgi:hypothetical protein
VFDGEALARPGMKDTGLRQEVRRELGDSVPGGSIPLTPALKRPTPKVLHMVSKRIEPPTVSRYRMVGEVPAHDLS